MKKVAWLVLIPAAMCFAVNQGLSPLYAPKTPVPTFSEIHENALMAGTLVWSTWAACPQADYRLAGSKGNIVGGVSPNDTTIYIFGGNTYPNQAYRYNPTTNNWTQLASIPQTISNMDACYCKGKIYIALGYNPNSGSMYNTMLIYTIATNSWSYGATCPWGSDYGAMMAAIGDTVFVIDGANGYGYTRAYNVNTNTWTLKSAYDPGYDGYAGTAVYNNRIYLSGGWYNPNYCRYYNPTTNSYTGLPSLSQGRQGSAAGVIGTSLYEIGGAAGGSWSGVASSERLDLLSPTGWVADNPMTYNRCALAYANYGSGTNQIIRVVAGYTGSSTIADHERAKVSVDDVGAVTIYKPRQTVIAGAVIAPQVKVQNFGRNPQYNVPVTLWIDSAGTRIYDQVYTLTTLPAFDTAIVNYPNWTAGPQGNTYDLTAFTQLLQRPNITKLDPGNFDEDHSNDTCRSKTTTIKGYDIGIDQINDPPDTMNVGETSAPACVVTNYGAALVTCGVSCMISKGGSPVYTDSTTFTIDVSLTQTPTFTDWTPTEPGTYDVTFTAGIEVYTDEDLTNNSMSKTVIVNGQIDVGVDRVHLPIRVRPNEAFTPFVRVKNFGANPASNVPVYCVVLTGTGQVYIDSTVVSGPIAPDATIDSVMFKDFTPGGTDVHNMVSFTNIVSDADKTNDTTRVNFTPAGTAEQSRPKTYVLSAVKPHPITGGAVVNYQLPRTDRVSLRLYDITGRPVRTLVSRTEDAGYKSVAFDGRGDSGQRLANGVYILRFETAHYSSIQKVVLISK